MIILDTHAWIWWWGERKDLSARARKAIETADKVGIATISCWEVAMQAKKRRIDLDYPVGFWVDVALAVERVVLLELTPSIAVAAAELDWENRDPADRLIVASAIVHDAPIVTKDRKMHAYPGVRTIW